MSVIEHDTQAKQALRYANEVRTAKARARDRLKALTVGACREEMIAVLHAEVMAPEFAAMSLRHFLSVQRRFGEVKTARMVRELGVTSDSRRLRELTTRQRVLLADLLDPPEDRA